MRYENNKRTKDPFLGKIKNISVEISIPKGRTWMELEESSKREVDTKYFKIIIYGFTFQKKKKKRK